MMSSVVSAPRPFGADRRLVDYVAVAGYDHQRGRRDKGAKGNEQNTSFFCQGTILQRFPKQDWSDTPFIEGLEHFCQPNGWVLRTEKEEPKFFIAGLTDINGSRLYCAVLSFSEAVAKEELEAERGRAADEETEDDVAAVEGYTSLAHQSQPPRGRSTSLPRHVVPGVSLPALAHDTLMFAPKCLVLVSRHDYPDLLRNCLGVVYTAYSECLVGVGGERIKLETLVGNLLGGVYVPPSGGPQVRFSLGATDKMTLQPSVSSQVPVSSTKVATFFKQLGIRNVLTLFCAAMTEHKILFYSSSFNRLTEASTALAVLMYPMRYSHVFIPILPTSLLEVLATPTPFIIGVHSIHEAEIADLLDVVKVDLDGGAITIPENMTIHLVPRPMLAKAQEELALVLHPELSSADNAFASPSSASANKKPLASLDKELRAVMLRLVVHLFEGYRSCLTLVRIHPQPYIAFHKAAFLGLRNLCDSEFTRRVLECMFFSTFISERGLPWRQCDIFDEVYSVYGEQTLLEEQDRSKVLVHIKMLAEELYRNENPITTLNQPYAQKIPQPAEGAMSRVHQPVFPKLEEDLVEEIIQAGVEKFRVERANGSPVMITMKFVPMCQQVHSSSFPSPSAEGMLSHSARRLGVLRDCIASIFENKISDAKKTFPAVVSALKNKQARIALCEELASHKIGNQTLLEHQQFDMIVRLMNAALQDDSDMDEHGIAMAILPLSTAFGRKLTKGVTQFAYTLIQDHAVWQNLQFWEAAFYNDVQKGIKSLYLNLQDQNSNTAFATSQMQEEVLAAGGGSELHAEKHVGSRAREVRKSGVFQPIERSVLELAASEIRHWTGLDDNQKEERIKTEENTVYSQAFVYINNMIYLLCPLDLAMQRKTKKYDEFENASNSISNSVAESDSIDAESGFEEQEIPDNCQQVIKQVQRFADKVCSESNVTEDHIKAINAMIPSTVTMHLEELEAVSTQAKRLPPIQKPKIHLPSLLPGEDLIIQNGLRVYLLADGRLDADASGVALLPAEGALFLTTYRLIFKGTPINPFAAEHTVTRCFPVTSLTKEKRFSMNEYLTEIEQQLKEGIQLRSSSFQLIRAAFDDEVTMEEVENFRKAVQRVQYPEHIFNFFAFRGVHNFTQEPLSKGREKNAKYSTIRGFASKTLKNATRAVGYQNKKRKTSKYFLPNVMPTQGRLSIAEMTNHEGNGRIKEEDEGSELGEVLQIPQISHGNSAKTFERLMERSYFKDWIRLGLIPPDYHVSNTKGQHHNESFRVTTVNCRYSLSNSYPALLLVPARITDDSLKRYVRFHKQSRFPAITWRHPGNHALLLRGAGFHSRGVMGMIRRHHHHQDGVSNASSGQAEISSIEAELYTAAIIQATPRAMIKHDSAWRMSGSELSINSLVMGASGIGSDSYSNVHNYPTLTPNMARKFNPLTKAMDTLTRSTGPPKFSRLSLSSMKGNKTMGSQSSLASSTNLGASYRGSYRLSESGESSSEIGINSFLQKTALYIFGDKSQIKGVKLESHPKTEFIPVDYPEPRRIRTSFKKLMRACVPSVLSTQPEHSLLKLIENSEWLVYLQMVMQVSGAVVDLMDIQHASVSLCLEDGWDATSQISSLAMLCLDPYYRTIEGFRVLIEKEWLSFGHRFNHRSNLSNHNQDSGYTPIFLQFLDAVHQIHSQFPLAFEFNQYYIRFLAYHHVSCRFRTFLLDNEAQRNEVGLLAKEEKNSSIPRIFKGSSAGSNATDSHSSDEELFVGKGTGNNTSNTQPLGNTGLSVFDYIDLHAAKSSIFHNFDYAPELSNAVLRPFSHISDLKIWDYYVKEELKHGPSYDIEIFHLDRQQEDEFNATESSLVSSRKCLTIGYDCLAQTSQESYSQLLGVVSKLESSLSHIPHRWHTHWERLEPPPPPIPPRGEHLPNSPIVQTTPSLTARHHGRMMHKRSTMELILKGKIGAHAVSSNVVGEASGQPGAYSQSHRFEKYNYSTPTSCDVCNSLLWGPVKTGMRCADCGYNCHEKCRDNVPKACSKYKSGGLARESTTDNFENLVMRDYESSSSNQHNVSGGSAHGYGLPSGGVDEDDDIFRQFSPVADENSQIICQGYLYKQANFKIKGWKQRWFVLDATKHQLRYYDTREDFHCKGHIDLSEVTKIMEGTSTPAGAPKKAEDGCFFDLNTLKRTYCFCAENRQAALEWINKIQSCLST